TNYTGESSPDRCVHRLFFARRKCGGRCLLLGRHDSGTALGQAPFQTRLDHTRFIYPVGTALLLPQGTGASFALSGAPLETLCPGTVAAGESARILDFLKLVANKVSFDPKRTLSRILKAAPSGRRTLTGKIFAEVRGPHR